MRKIESQVSRGCGPRTAGPLPASATAGPDAALQSSAEAAGGRGLLARAFRLAAEAHAGQRRRGSEAPYLSHPLQVAGLVLQHGGSVLLATVGLLHDTVEDSAEVSLERLRSEFGTEVARRVAELTDLLEGDTAACKGRWIDRKRGYLRQLEDADAGTRLVAACDKLDNLRSLVAELEVHGAAVFERFTGTPAQTRWYYESVHAVVAPDLPPVLRKEIELLLATLARFAPEARAEP